MSNTFDRICKYIPLTLLYLEENRVSDPVLYSYYFTFCDDITNFVYNICPGVHISGNVEHNTNCIIESIKNKLLWNAYTTNT